MLAVNVADSAKILATSNPLPHSYAVRQQRASGRVAEALKKPPPRRRHRHRRRPVLPRRG